MACSIRRASNRRSALRFRTGAMRWRSVLRRLPSAREPQCPRDDRARWCADGAARWYVRSAQTRHVFGERLHLLIRKPLGDRRHDRAVGVLAALVRPALARLERLQLGVRVVGVLTADPG